MKFKILMIQYEKVLSKINFFADQSEVIDFLLNRIEISFLEPEQTIVSQNDPLYRDIYFTGAGLAAVFKSIDSRSRVKVDTIEEGKMIGVVSVIYDCNPQTSVEALSYCTIATIPNYDFKEMLCFFP